METFYESVESDGEYSGEVLPPEKFAKALFDAYKNKDLTAFLHGNLVSTACSIFLEMHTLFRFVLMLTDIPILIF